MVADPAIGASIKWAEHRATIKLLLTDMIMPGGKTGRQLAQELQAAKPALKVIYTSGYSSDYASADFPLQEGLNFLQKPYEIERLLNAVRFCLDAP